MPETDCVERGGYGRVSGRGRTPQVSGSSIDLEGSILLGSRMTCVSRAFSNKLMGRLENIERMSLRKVEPFT